MGVACVRGGLVSGGLVIEGVAPRLHKINSLVYI